MNFPSDLKYTKEHEWVKVNDDGTALIGITEFAQAELGDIVFVDINTVGKSLKAEEIFGTVEAVKTVSDLFLPVSGTILELNDVLELEPELINSDPYNQGWMIKIKIENPSDIAALMSCENYTALVR